MPDSRTNRKGREALLSARRKQSPASGGGRASAQGGSPRRALWVYPWRDVLPGFIFTTLLWLVARDIGLDVLPPLRWIHAGLVVGVVGAVAWLTPLRKALWIAAGVTCAGVLLIGYTPLAENLVRSLVRSDRLERVEAVVVLSSDIQRDGDLNTKALGRVLRGCEVLRQGYAGRMVLTRLPKPKPSYVPAVQQQMRSLEFSYPVEEVGPVGDTHDEAVLVGKLARKRGWKRIIVVSDAPHMRRAGAVFRKQGLGVILCPAPAREYDLSGRNAPRRRLQAFEDWLWEWVGYHTYRLRGWI